MQTVRTFTRILTSIGTTILFVVLMFAMGPAIESKYFPVTTDIKATLVKVDDDEMFYHVIGTKVRHCSLLDLRILVEVEKGQPLVKGSLYVLDDGVGPRTRALGYQDLGMWVIRPIGTRADIDATYTCHPLWLTQVHLGEWTR